MDGAVATRFGWLAPLGYVMEYLGTDVLYRVGDGDRSGLWRSATE